MATAGTVTIKLDGDSATLIRELNKANKAVKKTSTKAQKNFKKMAKAAGVVGTAMTAAFSLKAIVVLRNWGKAVGDLAAITGASGKNLDALTNAARKMGASTTLSATQAATAFKLIGSSAPQLLENNDALIAVTESAVLLAEAAGIELTQAATAVGAALNQFGLDASQANSVVDTLAAASKAGAVEVGDLNLSMLKLGPTANLMGISFSDTVSVIEAYGKVAERGAAGGTQIRAAFLALATQADSSINPAVVGITTALENYQAKQFSTIDSTKLLTKEGKVAVDIMVGQIDEIKRLQKATKQGGVAAEQAGVRYNTLDGDLIRLGSVWEELNILVATKWEPTLRATVGTTAQLLALYMATRIETKGLSGDTSIMDGILRGAYIAWAALEAVMKRVWSFIKNVVQKEFFQMRDIETQNAYLEENAAIWKQWEEQLIGATSSGKQAQDFINELNDTLADGSMAESLERDAQSFAERTEALLELRRQLAAELAGAPSQLGGKVDLPFEIDPDKLAGSKITSLAQILQDKIGTVEFDMTDTADQMMTQLQDKMLESNVTVDVGSLLDTETFDEINRLVDDASDNQRIAAEELNTFLQESAIERNELDKSLENDLIALQNENAITQMFGKQDLAAELALFEAEQEIEKQELINAAKGEDPLSEADKRGIEVAGIIKANSKLIAAEKKQAAEKMKIDKMVETAKKGFFGNLNKMGELFGIKSEALQKAQAAVTAANTIKTAWLNIQSGVSFALANPWPANLGFAAVVLAEGLQIMSAIKSVSGAGGGGGGGSIGTSGGGSSIGGGATPRDTFRAIDEQSKFANEGEDAEVEEASAVRSVQVIVQGDINGFDEFTESKIIPAIQDAVKDRDIVLIDASSRNGLELAEGVA